MPQTTCSSQWRLHAARLACGLLTYVLLGVSPARAQSVGSGSISGRVTDETGATMPGVAVTVTSPALQLPQVLSTTTADGTYRFVDLPPGLYRIRYELSGFNAVVREDIRLNVGFAARIDISMKIGTLEESVTVSGQGPVIDVTTTSGSTNFTKETLETIPTTRSMWQVLAMAPGVRPAGTPDVGGSQLGVQQGYKNYGTTGQVTPQLEGINTRQSDSTAGFFYDYAALEEAQVKAVGNEAEVALPGTNWIAIVKSGGNDFHGAYFASGDHSRLQSDNIDDALRAQGINTGSSLRYVWDLGGDLGGRVIRDRLWFYGALRDQARANNVIGYLRDAGPDKRYGTADDTPGFTELSLTNQTAKGTYQASKSYKLVGFYQRNLKYEPQSDASRFVPFESTYDYAFPTRATKGELQATPSDRLLFNVLFGRQWYDANRYPQSGTDVPGNPRRMDRETGFITGPNPTQLRPRSRWQSTGSVSMFPRGSFAGTHSIKAGYQLYFEKVGTAWPNMASGDYLLVYDRVNGVSHQPVEIQTLNHPILSPSGLERQGSLYVQDRWTVNRVTLNLGLRWDRYHAFVGEQTKVKGVFGNEGVFPQVDVVTWKSVAPRAGMSWDVAGNGKSVVKATYGLFNWAPTEDFAGNFNQNTLTTTIYRWRDVDGNNDYTPGEVNLNINGSDFLSVTGATNNVINPNIREPRTHEVSLGLERELMANFSARLLYVYKKVLDQNSSVNVLRPYSAYNIPITRRDPGPDGVLGNADDAGRVTFYDYDPAFRGSQFVQTQWVNRPDGHDDAFSSVEMTLNKRMSKRWDALASFGATRNHRWIVGNPQSPNDEFFPLDETWDWQFKLIGSYQLPYGVTASTFFQSLAGDPLQRTYVFRAADPDGGTPLRQVATVTLPLEQFGARRKPTLNTLNLRASKRWSFRRSQRFQVDFDLFNALNQNSATTISTVSGPTFGAISVIVPPRIARFGVTYGF
jgi:hypothetical protein